MSSVRVTQQRDAELAVPVRVPDSLATPEQPLKRGEPCTMVILGAGGDLTRRKLLPALTHLCSDGLLHEKFAVIGVAREDIDDAVFRQRMHDAVRASEDAADVPENVWREFEQRIHYVRGDLRDSTLYEALTRRLQQLEAEAAAERGRLFYLAVPPSVYGSTIQRLSASGVAPHRAESRARPWVRVIIEKPFGTSLETAHALNRVVSEALAEHQIYRIDHYLGKETVQNLLVFRFANSIFEPIWNRAHVHHVQITAAETVGVEHRAGYYEESGVIRDMFQNHLLQLLSLTAMEPPTAFRANAVRDEKVKVLDAIRPFQAATIDQNAVRGQYGPGQIDGASVRGYREEPGVDPESRVPTLAALRVLIDNWRWQGVPFLLRSGKRMPRRATEIAIEFRHPPHLMFPNDAARVIQPNRLTFSLQPDEGISLCMEIKLPGIGVRMTSAKMDFSYGEAFGEGHQHSAYETLLLDAMVGDQTLFARSDGVEAAWAVVDPVIAAWENSHAPDLPKYAAGTWGPEAADVLLARDGAKWRKP
jgi:glucose-6-phosphate 1-dehydrogenase